MVGPGLRSWLVVAWLCGWAPASGDVRTWTGETGFWVEAERRRHV